MSTFRCVVPTTILLVMLGAMGCDRPKPVATPTPSPAAPPSSLPTGLFLTAAPADALHIKDAKPQAKAGDKVVLVGRIGGSAEPFVAERAVFTLVDRRLLICGEDNPDDTCPTPWDYCCEGIDDITANSVTIQVVGPSGQPLKTELNGVRGLKPAATVTVIGTVSKADGAAVVIDAGGFFVAP